MSGLTGCICVNAFWPGSSPKLYLILPYISKDSTFVWVIVCVYVFESLWLSELILFVCLVFFVVTRALSALAIGGAGGLNLETQNSSMKTICTSILLFPQPLARPAPSSLLTHPLKVHIWEPWNQVLASHLLPADLHVWDKTSTVVASDFEFPPPCPKMSLF